MNYTKDQWETDKEELVAALADFNGGDDQAYSDAQTHVDNIIYGAFLYDKEAYGGAN